MYPKRKALVESPMKLQERGMVNSTQPALRPGLGHAAHRKPEQKWVKLSRNISKGDGKKANIPRYNEEAVNAAVPMELSSRVALLSRFR
ncbi:hypothetical protein M514_01902 [Trichuris suis]|uniref:Uncharacterized protein n=1 Tax=Trichuris suis TaxID=68888 RepID=A0A085NTI4_9BILA|nr:hypothetical protein M513_01902 [Trichuris suis]KFD72780.1 hypothetical protein M514_01902 [Trichuris suis]